MNEDQQGLVGFRVSGGSAPRRSRAGLVAGVFLACSLGLGWSGAAPEAKDESAVPLIAPRVDAILRGMSDLLASSKRITLRAEIIQDDALDSGFLVQRASTLEVLIDRPEGIHAVMDEGGERRELWSDGKTATLFDHYHNVFSRTKVPGKIGPTLDFLMENYGVSIPLADFFVEAPHAALTGEVDHGFYVGQVELGGVTCHHLGFTQEAIDWQLWVEAGVRPLPRRLVITYKLLPGSPRYMATVTAIDLRSTVIPGNFTPFLSEDAEELDLLEMESVSSSN